ncbi:lipoate--protein ligase [Clostridium sp. YIM B02515]|uniref:lipoate--protein ligase n=1 Tax=Clostridium rhizosphaerae TaxID=2803861 RepID=A0ABS1TDG1_9CLOT|nr:lipoate--protein ligase [Clostridium rhizosphaerae]MBL4936023.1 lipoate--protein ligase [Clostridium rhizosphaerae]
MISIKNECTDPHFNLALEEYAVKFLNLEEDYIILWQNEPSVIIGRNQNTIEEINPKFINENNINVVRRLSGGGAVYHDFGNLNFTFIVKNNKDVVSNFRKFTDPIIKALRNFGVLAEFSGRNDITIDGKKFSGNAQYYFGERLLHHGTILFNSDLTVVQDALNVKPEKIESKGVKSVKSRVTNIYPYMQNKISIEEFKDTLLKFLIEDENYKEKEYVLTDKDLASIRELMRKRYSLWEWNYGESPEFEIEKNKRFAGGKLDLRFNVKDGKISSIKISGDFFGKKEVTDLENLLVHHEYKESSIKELLKSIDFENYFAAISIDDFIECMFY